MKRVKMINCSLFVDMDMVLVDLEYGLQKLDRSFKVASQGPLINPDLKDKVLEVPKFWANLPKMEGFDELWETVSTMNPKILTANTIWDPRAKKEKWEWIQKNCEVPNYNFYCVLRDEKQLFAKTNNHPNVLIDDYDLNCDEWEKNGGIAILHKNSKNTIKELKLLFNV